MSIAKSIFACLFISLFILLPVLTSAEASECHPPRSINIPGINLIDDQEITIFGEFHGTNEVQAMFYDIVCHYSLDGSINILVGLELSSELTPILNAKYTNTDNFMTAVLSSDHWHAYGDGRHSPAMQRLLRSLYTLKKREHVSLTLIGLVEPSWDEKAAEKLDKYIDTFGIDKTLVLVGNWHARKTKSGNYSGTPFAFNMLLLGRAVASYDIWAQSGEIWTCTTNCSQTEIIPRGTAISSKGIFKLKCNIDDICPYDGFLLFNNLSISR